MANLLGLAGATPQKQTRFAPIYNGRWSSGIWTNRSPLRDAATTRIVEKFYGAAGDALIAGSNVEITNRLTLARRAGNSVFDTVNSYDSIDRFYDFRLFGATTEQINIMIDQSAALYSLYAGTKTLVWTKESGAGKSYMQSVGNSLYWGDGQSNNKWLQSLLSWSASASWNGPSTPFYSTFFIDSNGNIEQLTGTVITVTKVAASDGVLTVTASTKLTNILSAGCQITFPASMAATFLENETVEVVTVSGSTFTAVTTEGSYGPTSESDIIANEVSGNSTPISGSSAPTWSTQVPDAGNYYQGGTTNDGTVQWTNRGNPIENWGLANANVAITPTIGTSTVAWQSKTYFSLPGVVIDSNGNLQQVTKAGTSGASAPAWATSVGNTTTDGTVTWRMIQTAASLIWDAHTAYTPSTEFDLTEVSNASSGSTVYTGVITGGGSNAFEGVTFVISDFTHAVNNGTFVCSASTATTLTLNNASGVAETNGAFATTEGQFIVGSAYGTNCLFQLGPLVQPTLTGNVSAYAYNTTHNPPYCFQPISVSLGSADASDLTLNSLNFGTETNLPKGTLMQWNTINGAGEITGYVTPFPSFNYDYNLVILGSLNVPIPGQYTFTMKHQDGAFWGIGNGATLVSGPSSSANTIGQKVTAAQGYPSLGGTNGAGGTATDTYTVNFPSAGTYPFEVDYHYWYHSGQIFTMTCNGLPLANGTPESGTNAPVWPAWSTSYAPNYPTVTETDGSLTWINIGPATDFTWYPLTNFTLPDTTIIDPNGNLEAPYRTGITGTTAPTFLTGTNQLTLDNPNLIWINQGTAGSAPTGTVSTYNGGWMYGIALVNTLDNTVSNCTPLSAATGNFIGVDGVTIAPGAGLPLISKIDPQADFVAIFRTTDGESTPFLIPGTFSTYTLPLSEYLQNGYIDSTPDTALNNLISGAILGENTPPNPGTQNLTYHLNRLFYSIGNIVYWTAGSDTPVGNGVNGTPPLNYDTMPSLVKRIVSTATGAIVFTVSDVYVIQGQGTASNPLQNPIPLMEGVGLLNYDALDVNGSTIGFFTSDSQFCIVDPSSGTSYAGFPIGDQLRLNNGTPGQSWNPANVYVTWYVNGEDQGWFLSDGQFGWYKLIPTPAPESGYTWSPFAAVVGGCQAVQSIEVTPGVHNLLVGPTGTGPILYRDLNNWQDNSSNYTAWAVIGSAVLAQPGQVASVGFITAESVRTGTPLTLGVILDEALPYYTGPFEILKYWVNDPPGLKTSRSFYAQRFYLTESKEEAVCRHMQVKILWAAENAANELESFTIFGGFFQEN